VIITIVVVVLAVVAGLAVLGPFAGGRSRALHADADPDEDLRRGLLRQLRDLDNDFAAGKMTEEEHKELRTPLETEAITVLRRIDKRVGSGELTTGLREIRPAAKREQASAGKRRLRLVGGVAAGLILLGGAVALLTGAISPRQPGATATGGIAAAPQDVSGSKASPIAADQARVKQNPKDVNAHLALAEDYVGANKPDQAAIEFLAVTALQPDNAAANTGLAVIAFQKGNTADAKKIVDGVLKQHPKYPEALYARGLIELMGMGQTGPAKKDLDGYLAAAPFGSHKQTVQTLLTMIAEAPAN
jgi:cytochrome c-type biogenesis protein CcmH/NrfG